MCVKECSNGYELSLKERHCVDIDECLRSNLTCNRRATCRNTLGGYECQCEEGFDGNGNNCYRNFYIFKIFFSLTKKYSKK